MGVITKILRGDHETRYEVFHGNSKNIYYASQIIPSQQTEEEIKTIPLNLFNARLTAIQINYPGIASLYSLHSARVNFIPFQFKPVLKLIRSDRPRLLIADEVGVGKTIEAGLILRELQARMNIKSILVLCPKPLVTDRKWQLELKRFDEEFTHLDGPALRYCINETDLDGRWPTQHSKTIMPFSLFNESLLTGEGKGKKKQKGLLELDPPVQFDLVIIDEAHHLRNTNTYIHQVARYFCENAEAILLLSATPIQLGDNDLYVLLNLLRPDLIIDRSSFEHMAEPNPFINQAIDVARAAQPQWEARSRAALSEASLTSWGQRMLKSNPDFQQAITLLENPLSAEQRLEFVRATEQFHTFSGLINRTRRRDIGAFTLRKSETVTIEFTQEQKDLHDSLLDIQAEMLGMIHDPQHIKFMMTTLRRQASSCIHGLVPLMQAILNRNLSRVTDGDNLEEDWEESLTAFNDAIQKITKQDLTSLMSKFQTIIEAGKRLNKRDPKSEALLNVIKQKQSLPNNKILIFSTFRHTLTYLYTKMVKGGVRVGMIHGDIKDYERLELRHRFSLPKENADAIDILLSSEVGCEGLDYQFCDCMVNYDIPWNPMRVEQRIGRIDRYGQKSESVLIYNFITPDTVDADIYERCLIRIGVFQRSLGGSEEILGKISRQIMDIAENYKLTEDERKRKLQQLADNEIRLQMEQDELEERQAELFGLSLPLDKARKDIEDASSFWLSPEALQNLVETYLQKVTGAEQSLLGEKDSKTLRLNQEARNRLLSDYRQIPKQSSPVYRDWEKWLKGGDAHLPLTFDAGYATENRDIIFITPVHPLIRQAASTLHEKPPLYVIVRYPGYSIPSGKYPFAVYQWQKTGVKSDAEFQVICSSEAVSSSFMQLITTATDAEEGLYGLPDKHVFDELDKQHYGLWINARDKHVQSNNRMIEFRTESLKTSHNARLNQLNDLLSRAENDRIQRMRISQIASAEVDFQRRMKEIEEARTKADIISEPVAFGVFIIE
ncbi:MAG: DEAD/DEAH box helicase family protein [Nitrospirae bacterium]|nr:DEAD/DEAH box helicase family protein [Nitrospirota bacterium]